MDDMGRERERRKRKEKRNVKKKVVIQFLPTILAMAAVSIPV